MNRFCLSLTVIFIAVPFSLAQDKKPSAIKPILEPGQTLTDLQKFIEARLPSSVPVFKSRAEWDKEAQRLREDMLRKVVYRGEAARWRDAKTRVEWLETSAGGPGYRLKKLRFETAPGLWVPALLYEPEKLEGKVPATLNVMGHEPGGKDVAYQQIRCINLARRGMLALNVEWFMFGQLNGAGYHHGAQNQLDLCGTSGMAPFYLALKRGLDVLLDHPNADPARVAVSGLSGGGWQTIFIGGLDTRVTLANPVAGYSTFRTRIRFFELGDSEQSPCDMATVADYDGLTALMAPRAALLTYNAKDDCCFKAGHALPPLVEYAAPLFKLYERREALRSHVNHVPGTHNYEQDNREAFYRMIGDHFFPGDKNFQPEEIPCAKEVRAKQELLVSLPAGNATFNSLALDLSKSLPRQADLPADMDKALDWQTKSRDKLRQVLAYRSYKVESQHAVKEKTKDMECTSLRFRLAEGWTIPALDFNPGGKAPIVLWLHDGGMTAAAKQLDKLAGKRVILLDPYNLGENTVGANRQGNQDYLWALALGAVGERPLGIQVSQVLGVLRWFKQSDRVPVIVRADGPRSSMIALAAAALEPEAVPNSIAGVEVHGALGSLKEIIEQNRVFPDMPELFCFGLLESFDVKHLAALAAPRPVRFVDPSPRVRSELAELGGWYKAWGQDFDPLK